MDFKLPPVEHMGIAVKDVDRTVEQYTKLGFGPFKIFEAEVKGFVYQKREVYARLKLAHGPGPAPRIDLIQTLEGENAHVDYLREKGEGIDHIGYHIDPGEFDKVLAEFIRQGMEPIYHRLNNPMPTVYLASDRVGGILLELIGMKKGSSIASMVNARER